MVNPSTPQPDDEHVIDLGEELLRWQVDEYPDHERSSLWFVTAGIIAVGLIVYSIATANFLFAVIILMVGIVALITSMKKPEKVDVIITTTGLVVGDHYYEFKMMQDFSLVYEPPHAKWLYVEFSSGWNPLLAIPLEDTDPNDVRKQMLPFCLENLERTQERLSDRWRREYKL